MKNRFLVGLCAVAVFSAGRLYGADTIQAFVGSDGRIVFTNLNTQNSPIAETSSSGLTLLRDEIPSTILPLVESISRTHGVDPNLVSAVMKTESNFNRWAVSQKGARGLMQLIPETGRRFGVRDFFDPEQNIDGAVRYLKYLLEKFDGNIELSLAAYNAGENLVERLGRVPSITETRNYVRKIRALYAPANAGVQQPAVAASPSESALPAAPPPIYRSVDQRGVIHFSNIGPSN